MRREEDDVSTIINLTPHALNIKLASGSMIKVEPSGQIARCTQRKQPVGTVDLYGDDCAPSITVSRTEYGDVTGIPDPEPGIIYVVSMLAAQAAKRSDVLFPGEAIRDASGNIVGCDGLSVF